MPITAMPTRLPNLRFVLIIVLAMLACSAPADSISAKVMTGVLTPIPKLAIPTATASIQYGVAPLMPISAAVAALSLWKGFFEASSLSALDNFFELGGDSLRAVRLMAAVRKELGVRLIARFGTLLRTDSAVIGAP